MEKHLDIKNFDMSGIKTIDSIFEVSKKYKPSNFVIPTGYQPFDDAMDGGLREGELITISAPTGMGKTTFSMNLNVNFHKLGVPSLWFTYEMNPWYLKEKFVKLGQDEMLKSYTPTVESKELHMVNQELLYIKTHIQDAIDQYACKIVFIDHLHYLVPLDAVGGNFSLMVGAIVRELKKIAVSKGIVIFLIAHTKKIYQGEKLDLSSIRDSSLIAQESDYVFLIERLKRENEEGEIVFDSKSRVSIAKNRRTGIDENIVFMVKDGQFIP